MQVNVTYRCTSRLSLRVTPTGRVNVSAPIGTSQAVISEFVERHRDWIAQSLQKMEGQQRKRASFYDRLPLETPEQRAEAIQCLDSLILPLVRQYAQRMGVQPAGVTYKPLISKWGSCHTATRRLTFSAYLLLLPSWCVEHVVVHELAHLLVPNHSPRFHAVMDRFFPRWREARAETARQIT